MAILSCGNSRGPSMSRMALDAQCQRPQTSGSILYQGQVTVRLVREFSVAHWMPQRPVRANMVSSVEIQLMLPVEHWLWLWTIGSIRASHRPLATILDWKTVRWSRLVKYAH